MNIKTALDRAHGLKPSQKTAAADLYSDIDYELAFGHVEEDDYERAEDALAYLREHFPDIEHISRARVQTHTHIPRLSRHASEQVYNHQEDDQQQGGGTATATKTVPQRAQQHVAGRRGRYQAARRPRYTQTARKVAYQVDDATGGAGSVIATFVIGGILLSLLLLALENAAGVAKLETGITNMLAWITNPAIDPLRPPTGAKA